MSELNELLYRAILVANWRDGDIDTEDGTYATTDVDEMIHLESAIQDFFEGMEASDLITTGRVNDYINIAIEKVQSRQLTTITKQRDELLKCLETVNSHAVYRAGTFNNGETVAQYADRVISTIKEQKDAE